MRSLGTGVILIIILVIFCLPFQGAHLIEQAFLALQEESMIRLDMSEYMERHTVSKLVGSPPGYVGYGEGGVLTEAVRRRPFTVILMDEIEKAHPDVFNMLLQIFEDGHLTDSQGRKVSFKNVLIVMTSNVGSQQIAKGGSNRIGFYYNSDEADGGKYSQLKELVMDELKGYFRPELLNRLDEVVVFRSLEKSQVWLSSFSYDNFLYLSFQGANSHLWKMVKPSMSACSNRVFQRCLLVSLVI